MKVSEYYRMRQAKKEGRFAAMMGEKNDPPKKYKAGGEAFNYWLEGYNNFKEGLIKMWTWGEIKKFINEKVNDNDEIYCIDICGSVNKTTEDIVCILNEDKQWDIEDS